MDLAVGTGVLCVDEGDAINPVKFSAIPLPHVVLDTGPDDNIDHVFRERKGIRNSEITILYPDAKLDNQVQQRVKQDPEGKCSILEVACKDYSKRNEEAYLYYAIDLSTKTYLVERKFKGVGSNPYVCFRWSKCAGEVYGRGPLINALSAIKTTNLLYN